MEILNFFQYSFIQNAFLAGSFIAIICSQLGFFLVLKKLSLIGDGLSHISFGAIALGFFLGFYPLYLAIPLILLSAWFILKITERTKIYGDAAIGIISTFSIALGLIMVNLSDSLDVNLLNYLFGNILGVSQFELFLVLLLFFIVLGVLFFFHKDFFSIVFDEEFARVQGVRVDFFNMVLILLTSLSVLFSIRLVGAILVSALLIFPAVTTLQWVKSFRKALFFSALTAWLALVLGLFFSLLFNLPTGATIILMNAIFFFIALLWTNVLIKITY